jgi:hypothetical protein
MNGARTARRAQWAARVACAVALLLFAITILRANSSGASATLEAQGAPWRTEEAALPAPTKIDVSRLLARDPFSPLRSAPEVPYRIGGAAATASIVQPRRQTVRLLGTVVRATGRSFAMCQVAGESAKVVYPGQTIGGLTLESVLQGSAVFTDETGARVSLRVSRTGE